MGTAHQPPGAPLAEVRLVLGGTRTVRVKAVDSSGQPVPGVDLVPWLIRKKGKNNDVNLNAFLLKSRTDAGGVATFDWLPADMQGQSTFLLSSPEYSLADSVDYDAERPAAQVLARVLRKVRLSGTPTVASPRRVCCRAPVPVLRRQPRGMAIPRSAASTSMPPRSR